MVIVENTQEMRDLRDSVATMAIEDMYFSREFIMEMVKVARGEKTSEELRQEIIRKHAKL